MSGKKCVLACLGLVVFFSISLMVTGCGGSSPAVGAVTVSATLSTVDGADTTTLTATVASDRNNAGVSWTVSGGGTLSNTSTTSATFTAPAATSSSQTVTITATSVADPTKTGTATITIPAKPAITTGASQPGSVGTAFSLQLAVSGGISPYTWSLTSGSLPTCLTYTPAGLISGTLTGACSGTFTPTFTVTDSGTPTKLTATLQLSIVVTAAPAIVLPATLTPSTATAGTAYAATATATGGAGALTYSLANGTTLPAGLNLNAATGAITGTPTTAGPSTFTIKAADGFLDTPAMQSYTITVVPGAATHFAVAATSSTTVTAGGTVSFSVTALDAESNTATGYTGTVKFTSTDTSATLPGNAALTNGVGNFSATLKTSGTQSITATDTATGSITGSTGAITVNAAAASKLVVSAPATATAGTAVNVTVTAQDAYGNTATSYAGTVGITSTDSAAVLPANSALTSGVKAFAVTLKTAGAKTVTATDIGTPTLTGTSGNIAVSAGAASVFTVSAPSTATAGTAVSVSVTAFDAYGNTATGYTGTVHFSSTDTSAALPANSALSSGAGTFPVTLKTAGTQTITAADSVTSSIAGTTGSIVVSPAAVMRLNVSAPATATAGTAVNVTVTAQDTYGNTITAYGGTVQIASSDSAAVLPANSTLASGSKVFSVTLKTAASQTITATDTVTSSIAGVSGAITVNPAPASKFTVSAPGTATAGTAVNVSVTAKDAYGNTATGYTGTVQFTSSDASAALPGNSILTSGAGSFPVTFKTAGSQTVTAADTVTGTINGTTGSIAVSAATATHLAVVVTSPTTITAGGSVSLSVTALDAYNNTATGYTGTVKFTSTDTAAVLPAASGLASGVGSFSATLKTSGTQTVTGTDTVAPSITGTTLGITVNPGVAAKLLVAAPSAATNNVAFNFTVTAVDTYNNTVTSFPDSVQFTSTDTAAVLPVAGTLTNGTRIFSAAMKTNGSQTITATDASSGAVNGTSGAINVSNALIINTSSLNPLDVNQTPTQTLSASGGSGIQADYSWSWTGAPPGLTLNASTGAIGGSPTTAGTYPVQLKVADSGTSTSATANLNMTIYGALTLPAGTSLPAGYVGVSYSTQIVGSGGSGNTNLAISATAGLPADGLSSTPTVGTLTINGTPTNPPAPPYNVPLTVKLADTATSNSITQSYSISVTAPPTPALPTPSSSVPGAATVNQSYSGTITASGGIGPTYTWTVNGSTVPTNGSQVALGTSGLYVTSDGSSVLSIGGTDTTSGQVQFTAQVKDNASNVSSSTSTYTIQVNPAGSTVSGTVYLNNNCGGGTLPTFTVGLYNGTTLVQSATTDSSGNYTLSNIANGTYTITPTIAGASSSVFYPANYAGVALNTSSNSTVTGENFNAVVGYTVSGTVSYGGSQTGQTYLYLNNNNCGGQGGAGTSISEAKLTSGGAFTIRGVAPGSYTLQASMDPLGQGAQNAVDPSGSSKVTVANANVTSAAVSMTDPTFTTPSSNPSLSGVIPLPNGFLIAYSSSTNSNSVEDATQYVVEWSTSPTLGGGTGGAQFLNIAGSHTFAATGTNTNVWILNNTVAGAGTFASGTTYYFQARSINTLNGNSHPSGWANYTGGGSSPAGVVVGTPACSGTCTTVSGAITIPAGVTLTAGAPLYAGIYQNSSNGNGPSAIYVTEITSPVVGGAGNNYSLTIPSGSGYVVFGILDQNNDGLIDAGDVTNVNHNNSSGVTISGSTMTENLTLPSANSTAQVQTQYSQSTSSNGSSTNYQLNLQVFASNKLPVAVTLTSGPNVLNPVDMGTCTSCGNSQFDYSATIPGGTPNVGDAYDFTVTYSDGTQETGSTVNAAVTAFGSTGTVVGASDLVTNLSPVGTSSTSTTPTFTWTFPANPGNYSYSFYISPTTCTGSCNNVWQVPGDNSNSNGFTYAETQTGATTGQLVWGTDPTGGGSSPSGSLTLGAVYNWTIQVQDSNGNQANTSTWYQP